jgi:hypothetical protein
MSQPLKGSCQVLQSGGKHESLAWPSDCCTHLRKLQWSSKRKVKSPDQFFFFDLLFSRNLMKSLKTLAVTLGWVSQPQVADLVCLLGNLILLSSMAVDLGSGAGFSPEKRGRITHYTTNWRWCLSLSLEPKLNWTAEPQGVRQSCQNSADRSGFCKPPEGWHADKLEWHRLPSTIASLASLFYLVSLLAIL